MQDSLSTRTHAMRRNVAIDQICVLPCRGASSGFFNPRSTRAIVGAARTFILEGTIRRNAFFQGRFIFWVIGRIFGDQTRKDAQRLILIRIIASFQLRVRYHNNQASISALHTVIHPIEVLEDFEDDLFNLCGV